MTSPSERFGIDLGGTNLRIGHVRAGRVVATHRADVPGDRDAAHMVAWLAAQVRQCMAEWGRPAAIGMGAPGIVDFAAGIVHRSPHFPAWHNFPLRDQLQAAVGCPVALDNDANAIAWGEAQYGAARRLAHCVMVTLGTGIGGGIVINRQLFRGNHGFAGEVGHQVVDANGPACACGGHGCWELYASASGLHRLIAAESSNAQQRLLQNLGATDAGSVTPAQLAGAAAAGDACAQHIWQRVGHYLGVGIASLANVLGIDDFVIGGGMAAAWDLFLPGLRAGLAHHTYPAIAAGVRVHRALLGDEAGLLGSAALADNLLARDAGLG